MKSTEIDSNSVKVRLEDLLRKSSSSASFMEEVRILTHMIRTSLESQAQKSSGKESSTNTTESTKESENGTTG